MELVCIELVWITGTFIGLLNTMALVESNPEIFAVFMLLTCIVDGNTYGAGGAGISGLPSQYNVLVLSAYNIVNVLVVFCERKNIPSVFNVLIVALDA